MHNDNSAEPRHVYARPADRSFQAYKEFIEYMVTSLGGTQDMSEADLRHAWLEFWSPATPGDSTKEEP